jgi:hypothetical protein
VVARKPAGHGVPTESQRPLRRWTRAAGRLGVATALAGAVVVNPMTAPASSAASTPLAATWTSSLASSMNIVNKVFNWEKNLAGGAGVSLALTLVTPLLTTLFGGSSGPSISDVLDELDGIKDELNQMQDELSSINAEVLNADVQTQLGDCNIETSELNSYLTTINEVNEEYTTWITSLQSVNGVADIATVNAARDSFVAAALGAETEVFNAPLAVAVDNIHGAMVATGGNTGVIQTCGAAYLQSWKTANALGAAPGSLAAGAAGAWVDDRAYYQDITALVQFWQSAQSQGLFLLEQAAAMQAADTWPSTATPITSANSGNVCRLADSDGVAAANLLCTSMTQYGATFYDNIVAEWQAAGVPYSDDDVVLSLGSSITGLGTGVPTTVWARNPTTAGIPWAQTGQSWSTTQTAATFDGLSGWLPANSTQWDGLNAGYLATHPSVAPAYYTPRMSLDYDGAPADMYAASGTAQYKPLDLLTTMRTVTASDSTPAFTTTGVTQVWMPNETSHAQLSWDVAPNVSSTSVNNYAGLQFAPQWVLGGSSLDGSTHDDYPYYGSPGVAVKCMVLTPDGVICNNEIGPWWVGQMQADYSVVSSNFFTGNWTGSGNWSVTPSSTTAQAFVVSGVDEGCSSGLCGIAIDTVGSLPDWLFVVNTETASQFGPDTPATVWPALAVPTGTGCTSVWGVPTRCGAAMQTWLDENIPNPTAGGLTASTPPTVSIAAGAGGAANGLLECASPQWAPATSPATGATVVQVPSVTWAATNSSGATWSFVNSLSTPGQLSPDFIAVGAGWAGDSSMTVTCAVTAGYGSSVTLVQSVSAGTAISSVNGQWVVDQPALNLDVTLADPDPTDQQMTSQVEIVNTGNVPVSALSVTHDVPGGRPLVMNWPGGSATLAPGQHAKGTATVDLRASTATGSSAAAASGAGTSSPASSSVLRAPAIEVVAVVTGHSANGAVVTARNRDTAPLPAITTPTSSGPAPTTAGSPPVVPVQAAAPSLAATGVSVGGALGMGGGLLLVGALLVWRPTRRRPRTGRHRSEAL